MPFRFVWATLCYFIIKENASSFITSFLSRKTGYRCMRLQMAVSSSTSCKFGWLDTVITVRSMLIWLFRLSYLAPSDYFHLGHKIMNNKVNANFLCNLEEYSSHYYSTLSGCLIGPQPGYSCAIRDMLSCFQLWDGIGVFLCCYCSCCFRFCCIKGTGQSILPTLIVLTC